MDFLTATLIL